MNKPNFMKILFRHKLRFLLGLRGQYPSGEWIYGYSWMYKFGNLSELWSKFLNSIPFIKNPNWKKWTNQT